MKNLEIQVNIPYYMVKERVKEIVERRINPEIYFGSDVIDKTPFSEFEEISSILEGEVRVTVHMPFQDLNVGSIDERIRNISISRMTAALHIARIFRANMVVAHPGYDTLRYGLAKDREKWLENAIKSFHRIACEAKDLGLKIAIENVFEKDPNIIKSILLGVSMDNLGFCFDPGHCNVYAKTPQKLWLDTLGEKLFEVHLHDNFGESDDHLPMEEGNIDFSYLFSFIRENGKNPIYTIEPHKEEDLEISLLRAAKYIYQTK